MLIAKCCGGGRQQYIKFQSPYENINHHENNLIHVDTTWMKGSQKISQMKIKLPLILNISFKLTGFNCSYNFYIDI